MRVTRRGFIKRAAQGALGFAFLFLGSSVPLLKRVMSPAPGTAEAGSGEYNPQEHRWAMVVDTTKCIGCGLCVLACKLENHVPMEPQLYRTWVERYVFDGNGEASIDSPNAGMDGFGPKDGDGSIQSTFFVPKLCNQCDNPPCVTVCPVSATYMTKDGVILVDESRCIGCKYCIVACPYGARYLHPERKVVDKCTFCYHRITKGLSPACVNACPVQARVFGDLKDPESPVRRLLGEQRLQVLKPEVGTKPKVFYKGLQEGVR